MEVCKHTILVSLFLYVSHVCILGKEYFWMTPLSAVWMAAESGWLALKWVTNFVLF